MTQKKIKNDTPQKKDQISEEIINDVISQDPEEQKQEPQKKSIYEYAFNYLDYHYDLRFNEKLLEFEASKKFKKDWQPLNENDLLIELTNKGINISMEKLTTLLRSSKIERYNPFDEYFKNLDYKNANHTDWNKLCRCIKTNDDMFFEEQFLKWLVRSIRCALIPQYFNKQCLMFYGVQNAGKTSFFRFLCPPKLTKHYAENIDKEKDSRILLCRNLIINLDELAGLSKVELGALKSYFTKTVVNERLPFDRKNSILYRTANFVGSIDTREFLSDEAGSIRWLCFELLEPINWKKYTSEVNIDNVWAFALKLYHDPKYEYEMTKEEANKLQAKNKDYQVRTIEMELIMKYFRPSKKENFDSVFMNATAILEYITNNNILGQKLNRISIGKALKFLGYEQVKNNDIYGYYVVEISKNNLNL